MAPKPGPRLELQGITKRFPGRLANDGIDLTLHPGEIHALLGENGAGKSTLVKILYGALQADAGTMRWHGKPMTVPSPAAAQRLGIGMVFQHFSLFESMTVAENLRLGLDDRAAAGLDVRISAVSARYGLPLDPAQRIHALSVGERQRVEVVRCLLQQPQVLVLDEPTAVLSPEEIRHLFATLRRLAAEGCAILFISHKLEEIRTLCQRATILRDGRVVGRCDPATTSAAALAQMMVGHVPVPPAAHDGRTKGAVRLRVAGLATDPGHSHAMALRDITFEIRGGEILGIAGVAGNGQGELVAALSGERPLALPAMIELDGEAVGGLGPQQRRMLGLAVVPEDRLGSSTVPALSLAENALLTGFAARHLVQWGLIRFAAVRRFAASILKTFKVMAAGPQSEAGSLSGGNLQKFVVGRELLQFPGVLVAATPTWGIDAGAAAEIHQALIDLARSGSAVLLISPDLDELFLLSDRIAVMSRGRLSAPVAVQETDSARIGMAMGGVLETAGHVPIEAAPPPNRPSHAATGEEEMQHVPSPATGGAAPGWGRRHPEHTWILPRLERRPLRSRLWTVLAPLLAVTLTVLSGLPLFALLGFPPLAALQAFFVEPVSTLRGLTELAVKATPLTLCAVGLAPAFRANVWNIGAEGQLIAGAIGGSAVALACWGAEGWWTLPLMILAAMAGGMAWAAIPAWLRVRWNASEIITSLMLSYVATLLLRYLVSGPLRDPAGFAFPESRLFGADALLPLLVPGTRLHLGALFALLAAAAVWLVLSRSFLGFRIKVQGLAPGAAAHVGFDPGRTVWITLLASGALAGLAGLIEVAGPIGQLTPSVSPGYGFTAIIVAFLGRLHPLGIVAAALLMALSYLGGEAAQIRLGLPAAMTGVFQATLLFFLLAAEVLVRWRIRWRRA